MKRSLHKVIIILLSFALVACGFYLRGHQPIPAEMKVLAIRSELPYSTLTKALAATLQSRGIELVDSPDKAPFTLYLFDEMTAEQVGAVSAASSTRQYTLSYGVQFRLEDADGNILVGPRKLSARRSLVADINQVLGSTNEELTYMQEMRQEIVVNIMNQLTSMNTVKALQAHSQQYAGDK